MEEMKQMFSSYGPVKQFNFQKLFGFVQYEEEATAVAALTDIRKNNKYKLYVSFKYNYHPI